MATGTLTTAGATYGINTGALKTACTHIALYTTAPNISGTNHTGEVTNSAGYSRKAITWTGSGAEVQNSGTITFTATGNWGTVTHFGIVSSATHGSGSIYYVGALDQNRVMTNLHEIRFTAGNIKISLLTT